MKKKILSFLLKGELNFWELCSWVGYLPSYVKTIKKMRRKDLLKIRDSKLILTKEGKKLASFFNLSPQSLPQKNKVLQVSKKFVQTFEKLRNKIESKTKFDQLPLTAKSIIQKIELMKLKGDIFGKRIICIGDDDLVAAALALTKLPKQIAVVDIDKDIICYEKEICAKLNYKLNVLQHNFINPLPQKFKNKYDVFITEPPDTLEGDTLFFSRGVECLKKGGVGYLSISQNSLSKKEIFQIQKNILKMGGIITDFFSNFEEYQTIGDEFEWIKGLPKEINLPKKNWYKTDLIRVKLLPEAKPLIKGKFNLPYIEEVFDTKISLE